MDLNTNILLNIADHLDYSSILQLAKVNEDYTFIEDHIDNRKVYDYLITDFYTSVNVDGEKYIEAENLGPYMSDIDYYDLLKYIYWYANNDDVASKQYKLTSIFTNLSVLDHQYIAVDSGRFSVNAYKYFITRFNFSDLYADYVYCFFIDELKHPIYDQMFNNGSVRLADMDIEEMTVIVDGVKLSPNNLDGMLGLKTSDVNYLLAKGYVTITEVLAQHRLKLNRDSTLLSIDHHTLLQANHIPLNDYLAHANLELLKHLLDNGLIDAREQLRYYIKEYHYIEKLIFYLSYVDVDYLQSINVVFMYITRVDFCDSNIKRVVACLHSRGYNLHAPDESGNNILMVLKTRKLVKYIADTYQIDLNYRRPDGYSIIDHVMTLHHAT